MDVVLLVEVAAVVAVLAFLWVAPGWDARRGRARRVGRRLRLIAPATPAPPGPPIEQIAADLRRIRSAIRQAPHGIPVARLRGWRAAYDDVLVTACRALDLEQSLESSLTPLARELERERVERMLVRAGVLADNVVS